MDKWMDRPMDIHKWMYIHMDISIDRDKWMDRPMDRNKWMYMYMDISIDRYKWMDSPINRNKWIVAGQKGVENDIPSNTNNNKNIYFSMLTAERHTNKQKNRQTLR